MDKYVYVKESELSRACNQVKSYADFLSRSIEEYIQILATIQNDKAIADELICSKLSSLAEQIMPYKTSIYDECEKISGIINSDIADISAEDNFRYPADMISTISSLLASFL